MPGELKVIEHPGSGSGDACTYMWACAICDEIVQVLDHIAKAINAHHLLIRHSTIRVKVHADDIDAASQQAIERRPVGEQFGPHVHAAYAGFLGQAHDPIEVFTHQRIARAAEGDDTIAFRSELSEDALSQVERQRLSAGGRTHRVAEDSATRSIAAQLEDDVLRQLVP